MLAHMGGTTSDPTKRRVVYACLRCRRQKIKCTGGCPCDNCKRRKTTCTFEGEDTKILVTKKHLSELKRRTIELEKETNALREQLSGNNRYTEPSIDHVTQKRSPVIDMNSCNIPISPDPSSDLSEPGLDGGDDNDARMVNPLSTGSPRYITDIVGRPHYLGHTSNWSLTMRLLHLSHQSIHKCPFPTTAQHIDSTTYDLGWDGLRKIAIPDITGLPSLDHSLFLINATKFHTGQIFHLFDEPTFMPQLYEFYQNPAENIHTSGLWFIHFLVIIALGKGFVETNTRGRVPPGANLFKRAFLMLPDYCYLWRDPSTSAELLCSMALYFQCIDWRTSAHNMIGQALRLLLVHGYHTNTPPETLGAQATECYWSIWWMAYILECKMSVLMGVPLGICKNEVSTPLPAFPSSPHMAATVAIHVKLTQALSEVSNTIYGRGVRQMKAIFVKRTQSVLKGVADVASELTTYFPVPEDGSVNGISRVSGYLNLLYHECIMLATRPFLYSLLEKRLECTNTETPTSTPVKLLLQTCLESARKTVDILRALQDQSLLESFLPFDLESAVSAGLVILMASLVSSTLIESHYYHLRNTVFGILDDMINKGNLVAKDHKAELKTLEALLGQLQAPVRVPAYLEGVGQQTSVSEGIEMGGSMRMIDGTVKSTELGLNGWCGDVDLMGNDAGQTDAWNSANDMPSTPKQLMTLVDLLNTDNVMDWATCLEDFAGSASETGEA